MNPDLEQTIVDIYTPEAVVSIQDAHELLFRVGYPDIEPTFDEIMGCVDTMHRHEFGDTILSFTKTYVFALLRQHGITPTEDAPLDTLTKIGNALIDIQNYEGSDEIIQSSKIDGDPIEVVSTILALVCELEADAIAIAIESVEVQLIERIVEIAMTDTPPVADNGDRGIAKAMDYCDSTGTRDYLMVDIIRSGFDGGYPFDTYVEILRDKIDTLDQKLAAKNLIIAAYLSCDGRKNPLVKIRSQLDLLFVDPNFATGVDVAVNELLLEYNRHVEA